VRRANAAARAAFGADMAAVLRHPGLRGAIDRAFDSRTLQTAELYLAVPVAREVQATVIVMDPPQFDGLTAIAVMSDRTRERAVERMRADFVANASHELRTPLASLLGFIETLQGSAHDDPRARDKFLAIMREQGRRMARLIDDLLSLSRIEQKQHVRPSASVDLSQAARHVCDTLAPLAKELDVEIRLSAEQPVAVTGDRDELVRVAENLIENAIKYGTRADAAGGDRVEVTVSRTAKEGTLAVRDFGRGIQPEHLPRLTERFYRIDPGQSRAKNGTGLGLAIVKHIVNRHRGGLIVESTPGAGALFTVYIPMAPPPAAAGPA
jgi:two-component system phosphate regulon sensor histidine kinase PhoR